MNPRYDLVPPLVPFLSGLDVKNVSVNIGTDILLYRNILSFDENLLFKVGSSTLTTSCVQTSKVLLAASRPIPQR